MPNFPWSYCDVLFWGAPNSMFNEGNTCKYRMLLNIFPFSRCWPPEFTHIHIPFLIARNLLAPSSATTFSLLCYCCAILRRKKPPLGSAASSPFLPTNNQGFPPIITPVHVLDQFRAEVRGNRGSHLGLVMVHVGSEKIRVFFV